MDMPAPDSDFASDADEVSDPAVPRAERRLKLLEEITGIGMELLRTLKPGAAGTEAAKGRDPAEIFAPLSRAVRLTLTLEAKTDQELRDLKAGIVRAREEDRTRLAKRERKAAAKDAETRKHKVWEAVFEVAEVEIEPGEDFDNLMEALDERLEVDPAYADCGERPVRETAQRLFKDLMLNPDMSQWDDEADGWIRDERGRKRASPFHRPSRKPFLNDLGELIETPPEPVPHDLQ